MDQSKHFPDWGCNITNKDSFFNNPLTQDLETLLKEYQFT